MKRHTQQTLALAGIAQAAYLVDQLGQHGFAAHDKLNTCLRSLFVTSPKDTVEVYGSVARLRLGLQVLEEIFGNGGNDLKNPEVIRYLIAAIHLESKVSRQSNMLDTIGRELEAIHASHDEQQSDLADDTALIERLAAIYRETVSTLPFRIQVQGKMQFLKEEPIANTVRATLLASIRSAVLWRQLGGRRWHFLLFRKRINRDLDTLLAQV